MTADQSGTPASGHDGHRLSSAQRVATIAACPTPVYHETHRYCPSCPWTERDELGRDTSAAAVDGAESPSGSQGHHEAVGERQGRQPAQEPPSFTGRHDAEARERERLVALGWHVISGEDLLRMLRRVSDGETPDLVYAEEYANARHEAVDDDS